MNSPFSPFFLLYYYNIIIVVIMEDFEGVGIHSRLVTNSIGVYEALAVCRADVGKKQNIGNLFTFLDNQTIQRCEAKDRPKDSPVQLI